MDFQPTEEQVAVTEAAARVFADEASPERVAAAEAQDEAIDRALWKKLAEANLLGLVCAEEAGGSGLGPVELCLLLEQQGRRVAPVPLWETTALGAQLLQEFAPGAHRDLLTRVGEGAAVLTAAVAEPLVGWAPPVTAVPDGDGWRLTGSAASVPAAHVADAVLVPARLAGGGGVAVFVVGADDPGVTLRPFRTSARSVHAHLDLAGVPVATPVAPADRDALRRLVQWATVGLCALQVGVAEEALRQAAAYTSERRQFGRPLASFQGVALRIADCYIDAQAMRATMLQAAWRLSGGPADREVAVAGWWAAEGGHRVVHAVQHLHGGLGADTDYPVHRYFLWAVQIAAMLGGGGAQSARLGAQL